MRAYDDDMARAEKAAQREWQRSRHTAIWSRPAPHLLNAVRARATGAQAKRRGDTGHLVAVATGQRAEAPAVAGAEALHFFLKLKVRSTVRLYKKE